MKINDFKLERYFAKHEFTAKYLLSSSDCDAYSLKDVLRIASKDEIKLWNNLKLGYTESEGNSILRESISRYYKNVTIQNIIVASPGELNYITMNVLLNATDHVITIAPSYQSLYEVVNSIGCEISYWKPNPMNWKFDPNKLESLIKKNTKLLIINFPHNPTGSYLKPHELSKIIEIARKNNIYIFSDEMYHKLITNDYEELSPISDLYEKGISLWGTSKSFGLAGLRTGWIVSQDKRLLNKVLAYKDYLSICNSATSEILSIIALNNIEKFLIPNIKKIKKNLYLFNKFVNKHNSLFEFTPPKAGSTAFVKLNIKDTSFQFSNTLIEKTRIMTLPAEMFEYPGKYIRIGFGRENFPQVLEVFDRFLKNYQQTNL